MREGEDMEVSHLRRVPFIEQMRQTECGLCCVAMLIRYYKSNESISSIRKDLESGRDGLKLAHLCEYLRNKGMEVHVFCAGTEKLDQFKLPAIIFWNNEHYVVIEKIREQNVQIIDPAFGRIKVPYDEFIDNYSKIIMTVEPTKEFVPIKEKTKVWSNVLENLIRQKALFIKIALISLLTYGIQLMVPLLVQYLIDEIAINHRTDILYRFVSIIGMFMVVLSSFTYLRGKNILKLQVGIDSFLTRNTFHKMMNLPYKFFEVHSNGDLLFRLNSLPVIRDLLSEHVITGIIQGGTGIFIIIYMFYKSPLLSILSITLFSLNGIFILAMRPKILETNQRQIVEQTKLQSIQVEAVHSIFGIKTSCIEDEIYKNWSDKYARSIKAYISKHNLMNIYTVFLTLFQSAGPFLILWAAIMQYYSNKLTIGEAIAFYSLTGSFFSIATALFNMWNDFVLASSYMERIQDIIEVEEERNPDAPVDIQVSGDVILDKISFTYSKNLQPVIKDLSMVIKKGEKVAIVGASGSGKTTLTKIFLGLYEPTKGEVYFNGVNLKELNKTNIRKQIGVVPQDMNLFNKSILENIKMNNEEIALEDIKRAAMIAQVDEEIEGMPMKYHTLISDMGRNLSGGQRQRIALARAVVNNPQLIILDEATSSLDNINERKVSEYFENKGSTRIIIAHRLSTVIDADKIYVLDDGEVKESGTHRELMRQKGIYANLYNHSTAKAI